MPLPGRACDALPVQETMGKGTDVLARPAASEWHSRVAQSGWRSQAAQSGRDQLRPGQQTL